MYCRVLACDFDGTGASDGRLAPEVESVLVEARRRGIVTMLVTGRVLEDLEMAEVDLGVFDALVVENGAIVRLPGLDRTIQLAAAPSERFLGELRARGVAVRVGQVIVATWDSKLNEVLDVIRRSGLDAQIIFNRAAVMVLPSGVNKAVGVRRALAELGRSERNLIAFGDAENDLPLLLDAEVGVAARGSVASVLEVADERLTQPGASGVATYVRRLLEHNGVVPTPGRCGVAIGCTADGSAVTIPGSGRNLLVSGDPRGGKSWLAGLLVEQLVERQYRVCVLDPEGDHVALGRLPQVLTFGDDLPLPAADVVPSALSGERLSVVLNLCRLDHRTKAAYVDGALAALQAARAASGVPHWIVVDEAHYFFREGALSAERLEVRTGNYVFVTYRPSLLSRAALATVGGFLVRPTGVDEERYFMTSLMQAHLPSDIAAHDALAGVDEDSVGLLMAGNEPPSWRVFRPGSRVCPHTRHVRKYVVTQVADDRAFHFRHAGGAQPTVAHSVREFAAAVRAVPIESLVFHLGAGDFSRWAADVFGDVVLATGLGKLEQVVRDGGRPSRQEILTLLAARYHLDDGDNVAGDQAMGVASSRAVARVGGGTA